jgi:hypothetical protein
MHDGVPILRRAEAAELLDVRLSKLRRLEAAGLSPSARSAVTAAAARTTSKRSDGGSTAKR